MEKKKVNKYKEIPLEDTENMVEEQTEYVSYIWCALQKQILVITDKNSDIDDLETAFAVYKALRDVYYVELSLLKQMRRYFYYGKVC